MSDYFTLDLLKDMSGIKIIGLHIDHSPYSGVNVQIVVDTAAQARLAAARLGVDEIHESEASTRTGRYRHTSATLVRPGLHVNVGSCERIAEPAEVVAS